MSKKPHLIELLFLKKPRILALSLYDIPLFFHSLDPNFTMMLGLGKAFYLYII